MWFSISGFEEYSSIGLGRNSSYRLFINVLRLLFLFTIQAITYQEFLPALIGPFHARLVPPYVKWVTRQFWSNYVISTPAFLFCSWLTNYPVFRYNPSVNPGILNEFAAAAYRLHGMIQVRDGNGSNPCDFCPLEENSTSIYCHLCVLPKFFVLLKEYTFFHSFLRISSRLSHMKICPMHRTKEYAYFPNLARGDMRCFFELHRGEKWNERFGGFKNTDVMRIYSWTEYKLCSAFFY